MGLRELKNQILYEIKKMEELSSEIQEIEPSEIAEAKLEEDTPEIFEPDEKIELAMDAKQVLKDILHHLEPEYFLQRDHYPLKDASRLFNKFDVKRVSEKSTTRTYKKYKIPTGLKSKFGVVKKYFEEDKLKEGSVYLPEVEKSLESVIKKDVFTKEDVHEHVKKENEVKESVNSENENAGAIIDKKKDSEITEKGESKDNSESQMDEKDNAL